MPSARRAHRRRLLAAATLAACLGFASPALAVGTITGVITDTGGAPIPGMEVRAWRIPPGASEFAIETLTLTDGAGAYA
ncbi:MAG: hypothetical protein HYY06_09640, partial [Deltaproteobacteria bacterium]|nr:hypothetical protein [Deltaproteobacteria bacterium]